MIVWLSCKHQVEHVTLDPNSKCYEKKIEKKKCRKDKYKITYCIT